jgi:hypothetical protein
MAPTPGNSTLTVAPAVTVGDARMDRIRRIWANRAGWRNVAPAVMLALLALGGLATSAAGASPRAIAPSVAKAGPAVTVVGYGTVPATASPPAPYLLSVTLRVAAQPAASAKARLNRAAAHVASLFWQDFKVRAAPLGPPRRSRRPGRIAAWTVAVAARFASRRVAEAARRRVAAAAGVQATVAVRRALASAARPSRAALQAAYASALAQARGTAARIAAADGLRLGPQVSVVEGARLSGTCGCGAQPSPPAGARSWVAVTVSFATRHRV